MWIPLVSLILHQQLNFIKRWHLQPKHLAASFPLKSKGYISVKWIQRKELCNLMSIQQGTAPDSWFGAFICSLVYSRVFSECFHKCGCKVPPVTSPATPVSKKQRPENGTIPGFSECCAQDNAEQRLKHCKVTVLPHTRLNWEYWRSDSLVFYIRSGLVHPGCLVTNLCFQDWAFLLFPSLKPW